MVQLQAVKPPQRLPQLDGLRAIAIVSVFAYHAFGIPLLWMGVDLFFVLSGFLITGVLLNRKESGGRYFGYFYGRRVKRILPPYVVLLVVCSLVLGTAWIAHWYWFAFFATNVGAMFHQLGYSELDPLWSLAVEEQFYLFWPFAILLFSEEMLSCFAAALVVVAPVLRAICTPLFTTHYPIYYLTPFRMDLLAIGALLCIVRRRNPSPLRLLSKSAKFVIPCCFGALIIMSRFKSLETANTMAGNVFVYEMNLVIVTLALIWALCSEGVFRSLLTLRWARYVGRISYSMYLIHNLVLSLVWRFTLIRGVHVLISLSVTIAYATATWFLFEKRLTSHGRSSERLSNSALAHSA